MSVFAKQIVLHLVVRNSQNKRRVQQKRSRAQQEQGGRSVKAILFLKIKGCAGKHSKPRQQQKLHRRSAAVQKIRRKIQRQATEGKSSERK